MTTGGLTLGNSTSTSIPSIAITNTSSNVSLSSTSLNINAGAAVANVSGFWTTGTVNAATHAVGTAFTANSTLVNAAALTVQNQINTATIYASTSANIASAIQANSSGLYSQSVVQGNTFGTLSGTGFTANSTGVYANSLVSYNAANLASLYVVGSANLTSNLTVTNTVTFSNTFSVAGATTLSGTLNVGGAANLQSSANVATTLGVIGAATFSNTIAVTGNATFSNVTSHTGNATFTNSIIVNGLANLAASANITGNLNVSANIVIGANLTVGGSFIYNGTYGNSLIASTNNSLTVGNSTTWWSSGWIGSITGNTANLTNSLTASGNASFASNNLYANSSQIVLGSDVTLPNSHVRSVTVALSGAANVDTFGITTYRSAEYLIQISNTTDYHLTKILAVQNGTISYTTEYGTIYTSNMGAFTTGINGGNFFLQFTPTAGSCTIKLVRTAITV